MELPQLQADVLAHLAKAAGSVLIGDLAAAMRLDQSPVTAAVGGLVERGLAAVEESAFQELRLGADAEPYIGSPLPERVIIGVLAGRGGSCKVTEIPDHCELSAGQVGQTLRWLAQRGWAKKDGETLVLGDAGRAAAATLAADEALIRALAGGRTARKDELVAEGVPVDAAIELLAKRKGFLVLKERTARRAGLTDAGRAAAAAGVRGRRQVTQLTPDLLADGGWRNVDLQPYDVTLAAKTIYGGKDHAFQRTLDKVRRVFLEMGFTEVVSPWVESSFWDFDALFQPQDHPARDMQDTFYVARPQRSQLPDEALVERIRRTHEDGGDTGSTGWRYRWQRELAHKPVLRTHTTAATIRALAKHSSDAESATGEERSATRDDRSTRAAAGGEKREQRVARSESPAENGAAAKHPDAAAKHRADGGSRTPPGKYFVIGPVFRRETVDYKHLPVFHQVDGIIVDPQASLATLLGTLGAFYGKMGFPKVRFRPSFFPYTEPSAEVFLWLEQRQEWVEMGGSGLFRPEVTQPLGIRDRVLAWGLGLERLAMMIHGLKSIGDLYFATMPWLREAPLSRG